MTTPFAKRLPALNLTGKMILLLGSFGVVLSLILFDGIRTGARMGETVSLVRSELNPKIARSGRAYALFLEIDRRYQDAATFGEPALAGANQEAGVQLRSSFSEIGALGGDPAAWEGAATTFGEYETAARELVALLEGYGADAEERAIEHSAADLDSLRSDLDRFLSSRIRIFSDRLADALGSLDREAVSFTRRSAWSVFPAALLWIAAFFSLRVHAVRPLQQLSRLVARVARGEFPRDTVQVTFPGDEIGQLVEHFQQMTEGLQRTTISLDRVDAILNSMADPVIVIDSQRFVEQANAATEELFGIPKADLAGRPVGELIEIQESVLDLVIETGQSLVFDRDAEATGILSDGTRIPMFLSLTVLDGGPHRGAVLVMRDLREARRAELERKVVEQRLAQSAKLESVGQLAAGMAHEINTPTQYVGDNTRFLKEAFEDLLRPLEACRSKADEARDGGDLSGTPEIRAALDAADADYLMKEVPRAIHQSLEGIDRIASIVRAMKSFAHPARERANADLNEMIRNTTTIATSEWKYVANLHLELDPELPHVLCLPGEINQVILNIVVNAAQAIGEVVGDSGRKGEILIRTGTAKDGRAEILISDTGPGIPDEIRERIFDPFFTTKEVGKGTGQGLAIAHSVIRQHHAGELIVESEVGRGTTFRILLPQVPVTEGVIP